MRFVHMMCLGLAFFAVFSCNKVSSKVQLDLPTDLFIQTDSVTSDSTSKIDTLGYNLQHKGLKNYTLALGSIERERKRFNGWPIRSVDSTAGESLTSEGDFIERALVNSVFHFWYGTSWDFNGYTKTPNKGTVACGYFVSTTLKHIGFNVNRYKLAQQNPRNEALTIACGDTLFEFNNISSMDVVDSLSQFEPGLYFVGLSSHVGYILVRQQTVFFIHSNYIGDGGVAIEFARKSEAFLGGGNYILARITNNPNLIDKWVSGEEVNVVTFSD